MENIDMDEWEEININKKKGNKGNKYKKMQEYIKDKIENKKLKICKICLGRNHTENNCRYKDFSVCKKCGFSYIGCTCYVDNIGLMIYYRGKFNNSKILEINKMKNDNIYFIFYRINKFVRKSIGKKKSKIFKWKKYDKEENKEIKIKNKDKNNDEIKDFQN